MSQRNSEAHPTPKIGMRVEVFSGDVKTRLGKGVIVHVKWLRIGKNPSGEDHRISVPIIRLDNGRTVQGCEVWWHLVEKTTKPKRVRKL